MKTLLAVCVAVCVGAVYSQIEPILIKTCDLQTGGWHYGAPFTLGWNNGKYYYNCRAWQPSWSRCKGDCGDSWAKMTNPNVKYSHYCECCRAHVSQAVTPTGVYCQTVHFQNECLVWGSGFAFGHPNLSQHPYYTIGHCRCAACNRWTGRRKRRNVDSFDDLPLVEASESTIKDVPTAERMSVRQPTEDEAKEVASLAKVEFTPCDPVHLTEK